MFLFNLDQCLRELVGCGGCLFKTLGAPLHSSCSLSTPQQSVSARPHPRLPCQAQRHLSVAFVCIFRVTNGVKHLFIHIFAIWLFSFGKCFFKCITHFSFEFERLCSGYKLFVSYICCKYFLAFVTYIFTLSETGRIQDGRIVCVIHFFVNYR